MDVRLRPRFERDTTVDLARLRERLKEAIQRPSGALTGEVLETHAQLMIGAERRHAWSPCLSLTFVAVEDDDAGARLRICGFFGPSPALWTMIATLYGFCAFMIFVGVMVGWSQWLIDQTPYGLLLVPAGLLIAVILFVVSLSGQRLAHDEMHELAGVVDAAAEVEAGATAAP